MQRGDICLIDLGVGKGNIQGGNRPCVIVSNNKGNTFSNILLVAPITTKFKSKIPTHFTTYSINNPSVVMCEQIMTVNQYCVQCKIGELSDYELSRLDKSLKISLGLQDF